jgi:hypothetical protein
MQQYKYTTQLPMGVAAPDTLDSRFGTLHFVDGVPDKDSTIKLYDNLDFQRAVQGYLPSGHPLESPRARTFAPDKRMEKILTEAAAVGDATARAIMYRWQTPDGYYYPNSAWHLGFIGGYKFEENGARLLNAYSGFFSRRRV